MGVASSSTHILVSPQRTLLTLVIILSLDSRIWHSLTTFRLVFSVSYVRVCGISWRQCVPLSFLAFSIPRPFAKTPPAISADAVWKGWCGGGPHPAIRNSPQTCRRRRHGYRFTDVRQTSPQLPRFDTSTRLIGCHPHN